MKEIILDHKAVLDHLPDRDPWAHKGRFGRVLLLCGSLGYTGAAYLAAMGALRCGSGLVYLGVPQSIYAIEAVKLSEAIVFPLAEEDGKLASSALDEILTRLPGMDAVLIGCGLGRSPEVEQVVCQVLRSAQCPVVLDADGINVIGAHRDILRGRSAATVLTPHAGEFARLGPAMLADDMHTAAAFADNWNCILVLKGHETCITDGSTHYRNRTGNPGMAVGGSGDLLAGMIVSLVGQGLQPLHAAACAAWLHGAAGDLTAAQLGQMAMLPSDMLQHLPRLLK